MISTFFQSSTVTRGYFPHIMCWCGVTMSSVYRGTRRHRVMSKALQKQHNLALFPPFLEFESTFSSHNILNKMVRLAKLCGMHCPEWQLHCIPRGNTVGIEQPYIGRSHWLPKSSYLYTSMLSLSHTHTHTHKSVISPAISCIFVLTVCDVLIIFKHESHKCLRSLMTFSFLVKQNQKKVQIELTCKV